jgi:hypothetical protein
MDPNRARQLLNAERARIARSLAQLRHTDTAEANDYVDSTITAWAEIGRGAGGVARARPTWSGS